MGFKYLKGSQVQMFRKDAPSENERGLGLPVLAIYPGKA